MNSDVLVVGSANADLVVAADRRPTGGETVLGGDTAISPGGKGANTAVAADRRTRRRAGRRKGREGAAEPLAGRGAVTGDAGQARRPAGQRARSRLADRAWRGLPEAPRPRAAGGGRHARRGRRGRRGEGR